MSKRANPTAIGAFVIGAIVLIVITLSLLGGGKLFSYSETYILYFDRSLKGLRVGANVTFRGIRIGQVRDVFVEIDEVDQEMSIPVIIEIEENSFRSPEGKKYRMSGGQSWFRPGFVETIQEDDTNDDDAMDQLIERGLRAILELESIVTGQLQINLDFYPGTEAIFRSTKKEYEEIPTIPSEIQQIFEGLQKFASKLEHIDIEELINDLTATIEGIEDLVNAPEVMNSIKGFDKLVNSADTQELTASLQRSLDNLDVTMADIQKLTTNIGSQVDPMSNELSQTLQETRNAINVIQGTFADIRDKMNDETIRYELSTAINELSHAARSFRIFVDYLERHPESFISGKPSTQ